MAEGDDPAYKVVKTLEVELTIGGETLKRSGVDTDVVRLISTNPAPPRAAEIHRAEDGALTLVAREAGQYEVRTAARGELSGEH